MHGTTWRRRVALGALVAMAGLPAGCDHKAPTADPGAVALPAVPAPAGLVAEMTLGHPDASWKRLRDMVGGPAKFMPASYSMLIATMLGLPPLAADQIDADVPTVGAVVADAKGEVPVVAIHVRDGAMMEKLLTDGPDGRFLAKADAPSRVTVLEPKPGQTAMGPVLGISGNYLLVGYAPDGLLRLGPYATRTLGSQPAPKEDLVVRSDHDALAGPLRARLSTWWGEMRTGLEKSDQDMRDKHGGSAPSFGDPRAAMQKADATFQGIFALMSDLSSGRSALTLDDRGAHLIATLTPQSPDGVAAREFGAMTVGDGAPLLDLPASASVAVMSRDSAEVRGRSVKEQSEAIHKVLGEKLSEADRKRIDEALASWTKGRGDLLVVGAELGAGHDALFARSSVSDGEVLDHGIRSTLELLKVPAISDPLKHWFGELKFGAPTALEGGARGGMLHGERRAPAEPKLPLGAKDSKAEKAPGAKAPDAKAPDAKAPAKKGDRPGTDAGPTPFDLVWTVDKDQATYVLARDGKAASAEVAAGAPQLRAEGEVKAMVDALGNEASFVLVVLPSRMMSGMMPKGPATRLPADPLLMAFGRGSQGAWLRLDASPLAIQQLARMHQVN